MKGSDLRKMQFSSKGSTDNMTMLRDRLLDIFDALGNAAIPPDQAKEMTNAAGKVINTAKTQIEYAVQRNETPNIPFMK